MNPGAWPPPRAGERWLLRLPNWIGDAILVLPAVRALPPGLRLEGAAHPRVLELYGAAGGFDELWPSGGARAPWRAWRRSRRARPDRTLVFTEAMAGALLARVSGAARRLGRGSGVRGALFTRALSPLRRDRPLWRSYLELALAAGGEEPVRPDFRIDPGDEARSAVRRLLGEVPPAMRVALAPGASYGPAKRWPLDRFRRLADALHARGAEVVVIGGGEEVSMGRSLATCGARDLTGRTRLREAVAVLGACRVLVTNDSGAMHLGRAAGTPVIALFGSSSPGWTGPESHEGIVLERELECRPCFRRNCPLPAGRKLGCLTSIEVEDVLDALERVGVQP